MYTVPCCRPNWFLIFSNKTASCSSLFAGLVNLLSWVSFNTPVEWPDPHVCKLPWVVFVLPWLFSPPFNGANTIGNPLGSFISTPVYFGPDMEVKVVVQSLFWILWLTPVVINWILSL